MRTDDLRFMPHVRHLVQDEGLTFENSFSPNPLCAPARSSLLTGRYSHNTGVLSVLPPVDYSAFDDRAGLGTAMNAAGYNTLFLGKYMNGYGNGPPRVTGQNSFRYVPPGWTDWEGSVERPADSGYPSGGTYSYYHVILNHNGTIDDTHRGTYQSVAEGRIARRMVTTYARSRKPFFLYFAPIAPHFGAPREKDDPSPQVFPRTGSTETFKTPARPARVRGRFDDEITRASGLPLGGGDPQPDMRGLPRPMRSLPRIDPAEQKAMLAVTRQRAEALYVLDEQVGRLVHTLKTTGAYRHTVVMFTSDNGYFLGEHRMRQGKIWTQEPSLRVPFLVAGPGIPHGRRYDPISSPDIAATVMALGHARPPFPGDGVSLVPSLRRDRGWRVPVLLENQLHDRVLRTAPASGRKGFPPGVTASGIRTARWYYVRYVDGDGELYDLDRDPDQLHNLYGRPRVTVVQSQLARVWARTRDCSGASCRAPLPAGLRTGPRALAASTEGQQRIIAARYGVDAP